MEETMRAGTFTFLFFSLVAPPQAKTEGVYCAFYLPEDAYDVPEWHVPAFSHIIDTGVQFEDGGERFQEHIIATKPILLPERTGIEPDTILYYGEPMTRRELENTITAEYCGVNTPGM